MKREGVCLRKKCKLFNKTASTKDSGDHFASEEDDKEAEGNEVVISEEDEGGAEDSCEH